MGLEDGSEHTILQPSSIHLRVGHMLTKLHMATDVMPPITITHIGSGRCKIRKKSQGSPFVIGIPWESQLITMAAQSSPTMINERTRCLEALFLSLTQHIVEEGIIEPERITQSFHITALAPLLPVKPPEIHSLFLQRMNNRIEIGICPCLLTHTKWYWSTPAFLAFGFFDIDILISFFSVDIVGGAIIIIGTREIIFHETVITFFIRTYTWSWMQVEGSFIAHGMEVMKETYWIWKQVTIPGIAGPSSALSEFIMSRTFIQRFPSFVPIHINNEHINRNTTVTHLFGEVK